MKTSRNGGFTIIVLIVFIVWIATAGGCALSAPITQKEKMK